MARVEMRVSDISGNLIENDEQATRLIVEHPDFPEPIGLDVLADEVQPHLSEENSRFVVISMSEPFPPNQQRYVLSIEDFDRLFQTGDSTSVLQTALEAQQQEQEAVIPSRSSRKRGAASGGTTKRERIDYSSPDHAGKKHRGMISEAEKEHVRNNLDAINRRNRAIGDPEIDPSDPRTAERYGFPPSTTNGGPSDTDTTQE
jgi:hypothetical protein